MEKPLKNVEHRLKSYEKPLKPSQNPLENVEQTSIRMPRRLRAAVVDRDLPTAQLSQRDVPEVADVVPRDRAFRRRNLGENR